MSDRAAARDLIGKAWDETNLPQTQFAALLRDEADLYETAPEQARDPNRVVETGDLISERPDVLSHAAVLDLREPEGGAEFGVSAEEARAFAALLREGVHRHEDGDRIDTPTLERAESFAKSLDRVADMDGSVSR